LTDDIDAEGDTAAGRADKPPPGPLARAVLGVVEDAAAAAAATAAVVEEGIADDGRAVEG
jgi:hypothetical protein